MPDLIQIEQIINQQGKSYNLQQQVRNLVPKQWLQPQQIGQMEIIQTEFKLIIIGICIQYIKQLTKENKSSSNYITYRICSSIHNQSKLIITKFNSSQQIYYSNLISLIINKRQLVSKIKNLKLKCQFEIAKLRILKQEQSVIEKQQKQQKQCNSNGLIDPQQQKFISINCSSSKVIDELKEFQICIGQLINRVKDTANLGITVSEITEIEIPSDVLIQVFPVSQDSCDTLSRIFPSEMYSKHSKFDENIDAQQDEDMNTQRQGKFEFSKILSDSTNLQQQIKNTLTKEFNLPCETSQIKVEKADGTEFVVEHYGNGSRFEGMKVDGMRQGQGRFYYQDGGLYDGEWKENKMHGEGKLYYGTGQPAYEGKWNEDQFHGFGSLYNEHPQMLEESFDYVEDYWIQYSGNFWMDNKEGQGSLHLTNGERLVGQFERDVIQGKWVFYRMDGKMMEGRWVENKLVY